MATEAEKLLRSRHDCLVDSSLRDVPKRNWDPAKAYLHPRLGGNVIACGREGRWPSLGPSDLD
jgi:hypothetical protein